MGLAMTVYSSVRTITSVKIFLTVNLNTRINSEPSKGVTSATVILLSLLTPKKVFFCVKNNALMLQAPTHASWLNDHRRHC